MVEKSESAKTANGHAIDRLRCGGTSRRSFLRSVTALTGGCGAAHALLSASGMAALLTSRPVSAAEAPVPAGKVIVEQVQYPSGNLNIGASLARPDKPGGAAKYPAVLVVPDNRGLNEHIRNITRRFAGEGFVSLAPDHLSRGGGENVRVVADAAEAMARLTPEAVMDDLKAAVEYLKKRPEVDARKVSVIGFGVGGVRSFRLATQLPDLYRVVVFYGASPDTGFDKIQAPVMAHYAEWDQTISGNRIWTAEQMAAAGKKFEPYFYEGADATFFNDTEPRYNAEAAKLAWQRTLDFLRS